VQIPAGRNGDQITTVLLWTDALVMWWKTNGPAAYGSLPVDSIAITMARTRSSAPW